MAWRFEPREGLRKAFRRVSAEEIAKVRAGLSGPETERDRAVHEARQGFKRLRALVRLAKPPLGADFAAENRRWRDAGRLLSGTRDTAVLLQCFDALAAGSRSADGVSPQLLARLQSRLAGRSRKGAANFADKLRQVLVLLDEAEASVAELEWPNSRKALMRGFHRGQKRLRRDWKEACGTGAPDALHSWRKRVKDQSAQLRLLRRVVPAAFSARIAREKETAELLGDEHDLWLLSERLRNLTLPAGLHAVRSGFLSEIEARRNALRVDAFARGNEFSSQKAKSFAGSMALAWDKAARHRARKKAEKRLRASGLRALAISPRQ